MIKFFLISMLIAFESVTLKAQLTVIHYEIDHHNGFFLQGFTPGTKSAFYSQKGGGREMLSMPVDGNGTLHLQTDTSFTPAFVLDGKENGSKKVCFLPPKDFVVKNIEVNKNGFIYTVATNKPGKYTLEIIRSGNDHDYTAVSTRVLNNESQEQLKYEEGDPGAFRYKIRIYSIEDQFEVLSKDFVLNNGETLVYPNPNTGALQLSTSQKYDRFLIRNHAGQVIMQGHATDFNNGILNVVELQPGNYIFETFAGTKSVSASKFLKL